MTTAGGPLRLEPVAPGVAVGEPTARLVAPGVDADRPVRVLLVEPEDEAAALLRGLLCCAPVASFVVDRVARPADAAARLERCAFDVVAVALDEGPEALESIGRLRRLRPETPIVALTAAEDARIALRALEAGAQDYLPKSAAREILVRTLLYTCERQRILNHFRDAKKEIQRQREILESVVQAMADGLLVCDDRGTFVFLNRAAEAILGAPAAAWLGRRLGRVDALGVLLPDGSGPYPPSQLPIARALRGEEVTDAEVLVRRPDRAVYLSVSARPLRREDGSVYGAVSLLRDITERKNAERTLEELTRRHRLILDAAAEGIYGCDAEGRATFVNAAAARILGYAPDELLGRRLHELIHARRPDGSPLPAEECPLGQARTRGEPGEGETVFWSKDGLAVPVEYTCSPIVEEGRPGGLVVTFKDVSERRRLETRLLQAEKLESIGALAAGIAHEINTPMQYIGDNTRFIKEAVGALAAVVDEYEAALAAGATLEEVRARVDARKAELDLDYVREELPAALAQTEDGIERVVRIVRAMKRFSHVRSDEARTPTDLNQALESTIVIARNEWKYVAEVVTDFDADLPPVPCFPGELNQVFLNLLVNAAHAIGDVVGENGGKGKITVTTRREGDWATIRIADTGCGIPEAIRSRVFDPFFTTKEVGRGTGQGLSIAHSVVVDKHGGTIEFETEPGRGTTFVVRLPLDETSDADEAAR